MARESSKRSGLLALTREVSPSITRCELTHLAREPIDLETARREHAAYERALAALGCEVVRIPGAPELPDAVFVEDAAIILDGAAIVTRPGAPSRREETPAVAEVVGRYLPLLRMAGPGTVDGGDVLRLGKTLYVGRSARSDAAGIAELARLAGPLGWRVEGVELRGCLHLKSAATEVGDGLVLANPAFVDPAAFAPAEVIEIDPAEPFGANALRVGDAVIHPLAFPRTRARLAARGLRVVEVAAAELAKAEGGVTCCSLILAPPRMR
ncbi:MAG TPA: dimethylargininase [Verrucomicrobiae bacterium]|nr:dimethylargininase [Verrucomicrobiae bacterium]